MRHRKHHHQLGVKSAHRISLIANLSCSLIEHGRIKTTLAKAKALRPAVEKLITLAKKAHVSEDPAQKVHYRRLAIARIRNKKAVARLFDELVDQFIGRNGGYVRIYKLALPRLGDAADMALIEFVEEASKKKARKRKPASKKDAPLAEEADKDSEETEKEPDNDDDATRKEEASMKEESPDTESDKEEKSVLEDKADATVAPPSDADSVVDAEDEGKEGAEASSDDSK